VSFFFRRLFRSIGRLFKRVFRAAARVIRVALRSPIVRAIVQIAGTAIAATLTAGAAVPFITAAISSGLSAASGGSLVDSLKAAAFSFAQVHVWSVVGASIEGLQALGQAGFAAANGAIHGVVGGAIAAAQGGNFLQGFAANAIGAVGGVVADSFAVTNIAIHTAVVAVAGCAAATVSGGKCANGAVTAAFANLFNRFNLADVGRRLLSDANDGIWAVGGRSGPMSGGGAAPMSGRPGFDGPPKRFRGETAGTKSGRSSHQDFTARVRRKPGWQAEPRLVDPLTGRIVKPDAVTPRGHPIELKPNTPSGRSKGRGQLPKYERATGKRGRVIYYDP